MSITELKRRSRELIRENAPRIIFVGIAYIIIVTVLAELQFRLPGTNSALDRFMDRVTAGDLPTIELLTGGIRTTGVALAIVIAIVSPIIDVGFMGYCLRISRGFSGDYRDLLDGFAIAGKIILITIISSVFIFLWSLLLIFPGIIAAYRYSQAFYILIDEPSKGALQCIRESKQLMIGNKLDLFLLNLSFIGWIFLSALIAMIIPFPLPLVSIWLTPYMGLTGASFYNYLIRFNPVIIN